MNSIAVCSSVILMYFINFFSVLWPVIFMMAMVGMPVRYIFVAPLRRAVWVFTKSHLSTRYVFFSPFSTYDTSFFSVIPSSHVEYAGFVLVIATGCQSCNSRYDSVILRLSGRESWSRCGPLSALATSLLLVIQQ